MSAGTGGRALLRHLEDIEVGQVSTLGSYEMTAEEMVEFARRFDPQAFHVDPELAAESIFGGLIASGVHTLAVAVRLLQTNPRGIAGAGSPGIDEVRWPRPVRAGSVLTGRATVVGVRPSASRPAHGVVRSRIEIVDQTGGTVLSYLATALVERRSAAGKE